MSTTLEKDMVKPITLANPTPLGLVSFAVSTILLSLANAGIIENASPIMAQGLFVGGLAQMLAGILEFTKGNTFGCLVFTTFGGFWLTSAGIEGLVKLGWASAPDGSVLGAFFFIWAVYAFLLLLGVFKDGRVLTLTLSTVFLLFLFCAIYHWTQSHVVLNIAGWIGIVCGSSALYLGTAITIEETAKKKLLPY
ncbi:MAG: acetate uptake transporter [Deltaproteobacteria bacterium]|jgi:succinate-acetate transporter protein|nr:acetate uptake transporter [Deltaproteobacteria bacterium]